MDIGRRRDLTVLWLVEVEDELAPPSARRYITRGIRVLDRQPFSAQRQALDALLALRLPDETELRGDTFLQKGSPRTPSMLQSGPDLSGRQKVLGERESPFAEAVTRSLGFAVRRCALDATGLGAMLAEELEQEWGARVEPVQFTLGIKEDLAVRVKRLLEDRRLLLPADVAVRAALGSVKRYVTPAGNIRFDADRTEAAGHADHFWALALALLAAEEPALSVEFVSTAIPRPFSQAYIF